MRAIFGSYSVQNVFIGSIALICAFTCNFSFIVEATFFFSGFVIAQMLWFRNFEFLGLVLFLLLIGFGVTIEMSPLVFSALLLFSFPAALGMLLARYRLTKIILQKNPVATMKMQLDQAKQHEKYCQQLLFEQTRHIDELKSACSTQLDENEKLKALLQVHKAEENVLEYKRLYLQLKEQHEGIKNELGSMRHSFFCEQLRAEALEKKAEEMEMLLTESSCSDLVTLMRQYSEEHTQLIVAHHRDMVEYEHMIQMLLLELEKFSKASV